MLIQMESEQQMASQEQKKQGKRQRPNGPSVPTPHGAAKRANDDLHRLEREWLERLTADPSCFADVEREVHERMRFHADVMAAALLAKASSSPSMN